MIQNTHSPQKYFPEAVLPLAVFVLWTSLNLVSAVPGHSGDTVQFQFLAETYGVAHAPGAPFCIPLLWAWRHMLPLATPALAANLFSVVAALFAVLFGARLLRRWGVSSLGIFTAFLPLITSPLWLRLSAVAEFYVPSLAVGLAALECAQAWVDLGRRRDLILVGLLLGLGQGARYPRPVSTTLLGTFVRE